MKYPAYLNLLESGEFEKRVTKLDNMLHECCLCPHECRVDRHSGKVGVCNAGVLVDVSSVCLHNGEEPPISGYRGSGTIFFCHCNLKCVFCQNYQISQGNEAVSKRLTPAQLAAEMLHLQNKLHAHNINLVSPTHYTPQAIEAIYIAAKNGLKIPIVYNTNAYDSIEVIKFLDGIVDIYMPDIKYANNSYAKKYSNAPKYVDVSREVISEMYSQVGTLETDDLNTGVRGLIVRHLVLPNDISGSFDSLRWLSENVSSDIFLSLMSQYHPCNKASSFKEIDRGVSMTEYQKVLDLVEELGFENGWLQGLPSRDYYLPDFNDKTHPFENS